MRILIDSHVLIWWSDEPDRLSHVMQEALQDPENQIFLSMASVWEMQLKVNLGKLNLTLLLPDWIRSQSETNDLQILQIDLHHIYELSNLPHHHRDPFDRLIIAQSRIEEMPILTADSVFSSYEVQILN